VTVNFSGAATYPDIRILEYSGINTSNPFDVAAGSGGTGTLSSSAAVTTSSASDLLVAGNVVPNQTNGPGTGFAKKILTVPDSDIEDEIVNLLGSYTATAPLGSGDWVMQIVAFRAAAQPKWTTRNRRIWPATNALRRFAGRFLERFLQILGQQWTDIWRTGTPA
jgi:hypothetical protein